MAASILIQSFRVRILHQCHLTIINNINILIKRSRYIIIIYFFINILSKYTYLTLSYTCIVNGELFIRLRIT